MVIACTGRSSSDTLRSAATRLWRQVPMLLWATWPVRTTNGRSDQGGCILTHSDRTARSLPNRASSASSTASVSARILAVSSSRSLQTYACKPARFRRSADAAPSRPIGVRMRIRAFAGSACTMLVAEQRDGVARVGRCAGKDTAEVDQWRSHRDAIGTQSEFSDRVLMIAAALLHDRQRAPDHSAVLEVTEHQHGVAQIADIERSGHRADQAVLGRHQYAQNTLLIEVSQQLVHLQDEKAAFGHRVQIAVEAVHDHDARPLSFDTVPNIPCKFAGRQ